MSGQRILLSLIDHLASTTEGVLAGVSTRQSAPQAAVEWIVGCGDSRDIQEPILVLVFLVDAAHERGGRRQDLIDEDEDGFLGTQLDALADHVDELAHGQVGRDQVLLLVDGGDVRLLDFFADHLEKE
jgi:hypothetical protein